MGYNRVDCMCGPGCNRRVCFYLWEGPRRKNCNAYKSDETAAGVQAIKLKSDAEMTLMELYTWKTDGDTNDGDESDQDTSIRGGSSPMIL